MAQARYHLRVYSPADGSLLTIIDNWRTLQYEKRVNDFHTLQLSLDASDAHIEFLTLDAIIEVWRRITGGAWYKELVTMHRTDQYDLYENGLETYTSYSRGLNDLLHRRHITYFANTAYTLKSAPAETVIKQFVTENATSAGNIAARRSFGTIDPTIYGLTVVANNALGAVWSGARAWRNLQDVLIEIALEKDIDFEIVRIGDSGLAFEFRTYFPQRGIDRSSTLTFAPELGNMSRVTYTRSRTEEANVVYVLGQGSEASRTVVPRAAAANILAASRWNAIESVQDARGQPDLVSLQTQGDQQLAELAAEDRFEFTALQTDSRQYGRDYDVGDIITAKYRSVTTTKKITAVAVSISEGVERIAPEFADISD